MQSSLAIGLSLILSACGSTATRPVRLEQVVLYQNGVGYFERAGRAEREVTIDVRPHEVDDVLTTMTVVDERAGAGGAREEAPVPSAVVPEPNGDGDGDGARPLAISLGAGPRDVRITYATQTAAWRASYRLVLAGSEDEPESEQAGARALLQGWAVVDNTTAEDWNGVELVLATTAPLSFAVDLRTPRVVERPNVSGYHAPPIAFGPVRAETTNGARDGDGIPDATDRCPDEPEDVDGFEDDDGCPDADNDHDSIADLEDRCPSDAETWNATDDADGCPDRGRVVIQDQSIVILEKIYFAAESAEIDVRSQPILDAVAAALRGHPEIARIEIQGHADPHEPDAWRLSAERAAAVRAALVAAGVPAARLVAVPFGATQPIDARDDDNARARNRRVEPRLGERAASAGGDVPSAAPSPALSPEGLARTLRGAPLPTLGAAGTRYVVRRRVSVPAGRSAMVAMVSERIAGDDILLYRPDASVPRSVEHPFRAARIENAGVDLVPGPIALFSRGELLGQGLLGAMSAGERAFVPYAVDETTRVETETVEREIPSRLLGVADGQLTVERIRVRTTRYRVTPGTRPPREIVVAHGRLSGYEPVGLPPETETSATSLLLPMPITARRESVLDVEERRPVVSTVALTSDFGVSLRELPPAAELPANERAELEGLVRDREALVELHLRVARLGERLVENANRSVELRRSVAALGEAASASATRRRLARTLERAVADGEALARELSLLRAEEVEAEARLLEAARALRVSAP